MSEAPIKKQALLIGINNYQHLSELKYARQDAESVADSLKQNYSFSDDEIILLTDAKRGRLFPSTKGVIQWHLDDLIQQNHEFDLFIFGFWGHGLFRSGQRYFCPQAVMEEDVCELGLSFDALQKQLINVKAKNTCMILDCCQTIDGRGNAETLTANDQTIMENAANDIVLNKNKLQPGFMSNVAILNSCSIGQRAYEWDKRQHGIFTAHLLDAMNQRFGSVSTLISYVESHVKQTALELGKDQKPYYTRKGDADIFLPALPPKTGDVFISHKHCNIDLVEPVLKELEKRGITYFIDREKILPSQEFAEEIPKAIEKCKALLLFWTEDVNKDPEQIKYEIQDAKTFNKPIIPYRIGSFKTPDPYTFVHYIKQVSHLCFPKQTSDTIIELVDRIQKILELSSMEPSSDLQSKPSPPMDKFPKPIQSTIRSTVDPISSSDTISSIVSQTITKLINEATAAFEKGDYLTAISKLKLLIKLEPDSKDYQSFLKLCEIKLLDKSNKEETGNCELFIPGTKAGERRTVTINNVEFAFRWCPPCTFMMGFIPGGPPFMTNDEFKALGHQVTLTKGFWMMETQVTQKQWKAVMGTNPSFFKGNDLIGNKLSSFNVDDLPVELVSWDDCQKFCKKCTELGMSVQLPTEAQWEYACGAGRTDAFADLGEVAWFAENSNFRTHPVGTKNPNVWGLYDMFGNVAEWCQDWYGDYSRDSVIDPMGPSSGSERVIRGGCYKSSFGNCQLTLRRSAPPKSKGKNVGFRCVNGQEP